MLDKIGTPSYMAPELWMEDDKKYDSSVDMWALGVVCYMLLSGTRPFHHQDRHEKKRRICHDPLQFPSPCIDVYVGNRARMGKPRPTFQWMSAAADGVWRFTVLSGATLPGPVEPTFESI